MRHPKRLVSDRKLRLFSCACCRRIWHLLAEPNAQTGVEVAERFADNMANEWDVQFAHRMLFGLGYPAVTWALWLPSMQGYTGVGRLETAAQSAVAYAVDALQDAQEKLPQCAVLRDIVGNPFRPVTADSAWLTSTVVSLAQAIYDEHAFDRLPILADALEDAGCNHADILNHCRQPGVHVRGCWCVDQLLGKT